MVSGPTILTHLRNLTQYLDQFPHQENAYFEQLIGMAFSEVLYLPFCTIDNDNAAVEHRVIWQGSDQSGCLSPAPGGKPDIIVYCYGFYLVIEPTLKTGANQWTQEFASAVRHCSDFVKVHNASAADVYTLLVTPKLYEDTYESLRRHPRTQYKFVPLQTDVLREILKTSILALSIRHLDLRRFFNRVPEYIKESSTLPEFHKRCEEGIEVWQKEVLKQEKDAFIGIKSYETIRKTNRPAVSVGEIFENLLKDSLVEEYLTLLGETVDIREIETILKQQSLAHIAGRTIQDELLFECVPYVDFKGRALRVIKAVQSVGQ